jgi:hypothetical protein
VNRDRQVTPAIVSRHLRTSATDVPMPTDEVAKTATAAWRGAPGSTIEAERRMRAVNAVVEMVYPDGLLAGRRSGAETVADHIATAAAHAMTGLGDSNDPGHVVRGLLARLAGAAQDEAQRSRSPEPEPPAGFPPRRTYLNAYGDGRDRYDAQRAATAARVAWTSGYQDGWSDSYWTANRIVNAIRHDELAATTAVRGIATLTWLGEVAESARQIADDGPSGNPARLARSAGASPPPSAVDVGQAPNGGSATPTHPIDKHNRRQRGM